MENNKKYKTWNVLNSNIDCIAKTKCNYCDDGFIRTINLETRKIISIEKMTKEELKRQREMYKKRSELHNQFIQFWTDKKEEEIRKTVQKYEDKVKFID